MTIAAARTTDSPDAGSRTHPIGAPLPRALTPLIGRERALDAVQALLRTSRLLTLTGAGGSGKTRIALEVASREASRHADGAAWIELASLADAKLLAQRISTELGVHDESASDAERTLAMYLRDRAMLLVLDNCEHLADACARLASRLLRDAPALHMLATSREALGVEGERAWLVPPLELPDAGAAATADAVRNSEAGRLFEERAQAVATHFRVTPENARAVAQICRRLDGIPLAIELAAARVRVLAPEQIVARLDDAFRLLTSGSRTAMPRHQTLRATVDWSYALLAEREQRVFGRLAAFAGGFTLEAAEAVCAGDGIRHEEVLDLLASLVERSLVIMQELEGSARYRLLEIVRQYAQERSLADPEDDAATRRRHAEHYAALAEQAAPILERTSSREWTDRMAVEEDNVRAALHWTLTERNDLRAAVRLVASAWRYWFHANRWREGAVWAEELVAAVPERIASVPWINALAGAGVLAYLLRDIPRCRARLDEAFAMSIALGVPRHRALVGYRVAHLLADLGEHELALARAEEAMRFAREDGEAWVMAEVLVYGLAFVHRVQGHAGAADAALAEAETIASRADALMPLIEAGAGRAMLALQRGDASAARRHARTAVDAAYRFGDHWYISRALMIAAAAALRAGDADDAARLLGRGTALREAAGTQVFPHEQSFYDETVAEARRLLGSEEFARRMSEGAAMSVEDAVALAATADGVASPPRAADGRRERGLHRQASEDRATPSPPRTEEGPAPALRVLTLGPLEIHRDGVRQPPEMWQSARARELFLYLLLHPQGRTREQLGLPIWPDASAAQVKNNLHVNLHHLRRTLGGAEWVVFEQDRYRINHELGVELDATLFESDVREALRERAVDRQIAALEGALARYRGDFLEDVAAGDWHLEHRDHLRRLWLEASRALAERLRESGRDGAAADHYRQMTIREPLHEEAHRWLMICLARSGDRAQALRQFDRLTTILRAELEAEPEDATVEVYQRLRRGEAV